MGYVFSGAFPVLPGKSERVKNFEKELQPYRAEWDRLCDECTFRFYNITLQSGPDGDVAIYSMEFADPTKVRTSFTDSPHDQWWTSYMMDVHGIDLTVGESNPPPTVFTWQADQKNRA